jgi:hypothetical protein
MTTKSYSPDLETREVFGCKCVPVAVRLVNQGLFPCAPLWPSLAVSIDMLEFVSILFVHQAPNERAWCSALELYLNARGYHFVAQVRHQCVCYSIVLYSL